MHKVIHQINEYSILYTNIIKIRLYKYTFQNKFLLKIRCQENEILFVVSNFIIFSIILLV